jgi:hypothetical protein
MTRRPLDPLPCPHPPSTVDQPFRSGLALTWLWCEFGGVLWLWPLAAARPAISVSGHGETWRRCAAAALASARTGCATARASPGPPGSSAVRRQGSRAPGRALGPLTSDCLPRRAAPPGPGTAECWTRSRVIRSRLHAHAPANGGLLSSRRGGDRVGLGDVRECANCVTAYQAATEAWGQTRAIAPPSLIFRATAPSSCPSATLRRARPWSARLHDATGLWSSCLRQNHVDGSCVLGFVSCGLRAGARTGDAALLCVPLFADYRRDHPNQTLVRVLGTVKQRAGELEWLAALPRLSWV